VKFEYLDHFAFVHGYNPVAYLNGVLQIVLETSTVTSGLSAKSLMIFNLNCVVGLN
jgi:hypothetical protein